MLGDPAQRVPLAEAVGSATQDEQRAFEVGKDRYELPQAPDDVGRVGDAGADGGSALRVAAGLVGGKRAL